MALEGGGTMIKVGSGKVAVRKLKTEQSRKVQARRWKRREAGEIGAVGYGWAERRRGLARDDGGW